MLKAGCTYLLGEALLEDEGKLFVHEAYVCEAEGEIDVFVIFNKINDGFEEGVQGVYRHVLAHACASSYWHWVGVDGTESLLINRVLANCGRNLFFTIEADQVVLDLRINNEHGPQVMNVAPLKSLRENVHFWANSSICNLRQFCFTMESKATKVLHVHAPTRLQVLHNVLDK